jgi:hypothetical protein
MTKSILASMAFAFLLAGSIQPSTALSQTYGHRVARHSHAAQENVAALRADVRSRRRGHMPIPTTFTDRTA